MLPIVRNQQLTSWEKEKAELMQDVLRAKRELEAAQLRFHDALGQDQVDYAIYVLEAAEKKLDMLFRRAKQIWDQEARHAEGGGEGE
jgi:CHASE3 domain sensor protein